MLLTSWILIKNNWWNLLIMFLIALTATEQLRARDWHRTSALEGVNLADVNLENANQGISINKGLADVK